ncbi:hypothetical protein R6Z07F_014080 [Ovis aries]
MEWDACLFKTLESKQTQSSGNKSSCSCWEDSEAPKCLCHFCQSAIACRQSYCCCSFLCSQPPGTGCQRGVMGFWKFPPFLVLSILVLYQAGMFHAAPFRSVFDGRFDPATLDEEESRLLLAAMVNDYEQMRTRESEKAQKTEGSRIQKRACNTATCMTHRLAGWLSRSGSMVRSNLLPTKMGFKIFSGPRRNFWF